jgi:membrane-associated PAP2 superfamily phosphatase
MIQYYAGKDGQRFLLRQTVALAVSAVALCAVFGDGRLDLAVTRWFFDDFRRVFPLTDQWLLKTLLHDAARTTSAVAALALLGLTAASWITTRPRRVHAQRQTLLLVSIACFLSAAVVGTLKHFSDHACPWDLELFGGTALYQPLFGRAVAAQSAQGCLPAAHPLAGYAWLSVGFALLPHASNRARRAWAFAFALGLLFGAVQIARGAHFLSHVLWSAWIVWGVDVMLLVVLARLPALARDGRRPWRPAPETTR